MMTSPINNFVRFGISLGLFFGVLFLSVANVSALSVSDTLVGYGYTQEYNGVISSRTWVNYNSNNLVKYNYDLPNSSEIDIDTFNFRFHITGNFLRGNNYILTFSWFNDSSNGFSLYYSRMIHRMLCYSTSWSSSSQSANDCFSNYNISYSNTSNNDIINITLSFTPINDVYGIAFINEHDDDPYSSFPSEGWEITDINYQIVSSGTSEIINNATENTENIINNQNQNTLDIINNQNSNTEAIIKSNMTCNYNLFDNSNWEWGSLSSITGSNSDNNNHNYMRTKNFITVKPNITYNFSINSGYYIHLVVYYNDGTFSSSQILYGSFSFTTPSNINQIKFYWRTTGSPSAITVPVSSLNIFIGSEDDCINKLDTINDSITDNTPPDTNELSNATGWLPPGPVDSILNLPLTLLQSLNNAFSNNSCQAINVNLPYLNTPLIIPCMSTVWEGFGLLSFFTWVGRVVGGVLLYKYLIGLYKWVDDTLTMRENNNFDDGSLG